MLTFPQLRDLNARHRETYDGLLGGDLALVVNYTRFSGEEYRSPIADILTHLSHHGAHHRGQMGTHASSLGIKPVNTDFIQFCLANRL